MSSLNRIQCWCCSDDCSVSLLLLLLLFTTTSSNRLVRQGFRSKDIAIDRAQHCEEREREMRQRGFLFTAHHLNRITIDLSKRPRRRRKGWQVIREHIKEKKHNMMFFKSEWERQSRRKENEELIERDPFYLHVLIDCNYWYRYAWRRERFSRNKFREYEDK